jgi:hypothetical protein
MHRLGKQVSATMYTYATKTLSEPLFSMGFAVFHAVPVMLYKGNFLEKAQGVGTRIKTYKECDITN